MSRELLDPIFDKGIRSPYFFNGRLLTAKDLSTEQEAGREQRRLLGMAVGEGIAYGFEVEKSSGASSTAGSPIVRISAGLAINPEGQMVCLPSSAEVALVRGEEGDVETPGAGSFGVCLPTQSTAVLAGAGIYILVASPASGYEGSVPITSLSSGDGSCSCNHKSTVEGIQFRLLELDISRVRGIKESTRSTVTTLMSAGDTASISKLRNMVAHLCFGTEETVVVRDPFSRSSGQYPYTSYGALQSLRSTKALTDCDVPLAALFWTTNGIQFIDGWSVRRRIAGGNGAERWRLFAGEPRVAENEAVFLQFEEQIEGIRNAETSLDQIVGGNRFAYLPPAGILPLKGVGTAAGFSIAKFFEGMAAAPATFIDADRVEVLIRTAIGYPPIKTGRDGMVRLYKVSQAAETFVVFTTGYVPFLGEARFDLSRWDQANFVSGR
jgi:hypothetical protein